MSGDIGNIVSLTGGAPGIDAEARDWVLRLMERSDDAALSDACAAWRAADGAHDAAFWRAWAAWDGVGLTAAAAGADWRAEAEALRAGAGGAGRRRWLRWAVPSGLAASVAAGILFFSASSVPGVAVATSTAETRVVALADGSRVTVGGKSGIVASVDKTRRRVTLERGQAFFEVAHDPAHPFVVVAGDAEITVRGTKFDVRRIGDDVEVNVLEGKVEVRRRGVLTFLSAGSPDAVLVAGQASELKPDADGFAAAAPAATGAGEWRSGRLYYADAPLSAIIADAQRYAKVRIEVPSGSVGAMSLTVSYRAGDIEGLSDSIEAALPVRVERRNDGLVIMPLTASAGGD
jgi:transmembrane sensor